MHDFYGCNEQDCRDIATVRDIANGNTYCDSHAPIDFTDNLPHLHQRRSFQRKPLRVEGEASRETLKPTP